MPRRFSHSLFFMLFQSSVSCGDVPLVEEVIGSGLFEFREHDEETLFDRFSGELAFNGFTVLPVSTSSWLVGQPAGSWRDPLNWDDTYKVVNMGVVWTKKVVDTLGDIATFKVRVTADFESLGNLLHDSGPTERLVGYTFTIPLGSSDDPQVNAIIQLEKLEVSATAGASIRFHAIIANDTAITMDQSNVILEELTLETGAHLIGNPTMLIRTDITNLGKISDLAGIIEGDFKNHAGLADGGGAYITGTLSLAGQLNNTGDIFVQSGTLNLNSSTSNAGRIVIMDGKVNCVGGLTNLGIGAITLNGGNLTGSGGVRNQGRFEWTGGKISGDLLNESSDFEIAGDSTKHIMPSGHLKNAGTITDSSTGLRFASGGQLTNLTEGLYDLQSDGQYTGEMSNGGQINNEGTFRKSAGDGESVIAYRVPFHNTGTVEVSSGTLAFGGGGSSEDATVNLENGGRVRFTDEYDSYTGNSSRVYLYGQTDVTGNGTFQVDGADLKAPSDTDATIRTSGDATVEVSDGRLGADTGGTLTLETSGNGKFMVTGSGSGSGSVGGTGTVKNQGNFNWSGGYISGDLLNESPDFEITADSTKYIMPSGHLQNAGTITDSSTGIRFSSGDQITNLAGGVYDLQSDGQYSGGTPNGGQINNEGTFRKSAGDGESMIGAHVEFHNTGTMEVGSGTLAFTGGFTQTAGLTSLNGGDLKSTTPLNILGGMLQGGGEIEADILNEAGLLSPGFSPGLLTIDGDYTQGPDGRLLIEIGGWQPGEYDVLTVTGTAHLDGQLDISLLNGFRPEIGDTFDVLYYGLYSGGFSAINTLNFGGGYFGVDYLSDRITLEVEAVPAPSAFLLSGVGLIIACCRLRRSQAKGL